MSWWQLAVLIVVCALILGALRLFGRRLKERGDERAVTAEAERYTRSAAQQAWDEAEMAEWERLIESLNNHYGPDWREP
jgi:predicted negative regulator of RcsB-dependent stress response